MGKNKRIETCMVSSKAGISNLQTLFCFTTPAIKSTVSHYSNSQPTSALRSNANLDENNQDNTANQIDAYWNNETLNNDQLPYS